jgi:ribosomal RNA-processing protein 36
LRTQELAEKKKKAKIQEAMSKRKHEERDAVASGKNPFYLKRKDKKKVELHAKFKDLQETGKLSKFMAKKRKKNASKDHRWLPTARKE